jgi:hypothetical protein
LKILPPVQKNPRHPRSDVGGCRVQDESKSCTGYFSVT